MIDIRLPNITGKTETEQLAQIKSYLYQFAGQLQWALSTVDTGTSSNAGTQKTSSGSTAKKEDPTSNFNHLKGLIIKSADIVNAYYQKIDNLLKLSGDYTASSDFGKFKQETLNQLSATNTQIQQNITDLQAIFDEDGKIKTELLVNGHIYSGIIEYAMDGEAIVGIEIGQTTSEKDAEGNVVRNFTKFARFTAEKLAFYDAMFQDEPVAYISNYMLVITNAWVKGTLKVGPGFEFDTSNGIALRWVEEV